MDLPNLFDPLPPFGVFKRQQLIVWPVKVIGDIGHLLMQLREGVAYDSPGCWGSTSKPSWQRGQETFKVWVPLPLMRL